MHYLVIVSLFFLLLASCNPFEDSDVAINEESSSTLVSSSISDGESNNESSNSITAIGSSQLFTDLGGSYEHSSAMNNGESNEEKPVNVNGDIYAAFENAELKKSAYLDASDYDSCTDEACVSAYIEFLEAWQELERIKEQEDYTYTIDLEEISLIEIVSDSVYSLTNRKSCKEEGTIFEPGNIDKKYSIVDNTFRDYRSNCLYKKYIGNGNSFDDGVWMVSDNKRYLDIAKSECIENVIHKTDTLPSLSVTKSVQEMSVQNNQMVIKGSFSFNCYAHDVFSKSISWSNPSIGLDSNYIIYDCNNWQEEVDIDLNVYQSYNVVETGVLRETRYEYDGKSCTVTYTSPGIVDYSDFDCTEDWSKYKQLDVCRTEVIRPFCKNSIDERGYPDSICLRYGITVTEDHYCDNEKDDDEDGLIDCDDPDCDCGAEE
ncbi:MAG: hypothetical protein OCD01_10000 [Fibrobacterales bacterium]